MLTLKKYQKTTLENLRLFLEEARFGNHEAAFEKYRTESAKRAAPLAYRPLENLETTPYVCLRLPTGGGKTLLGTYTISTAAQAFLEQDFPLVLWLVPSNTIRQQTLDTLKNPRHPNREAITQKFGNQVLVLDVADFTQIRPQDVKGKAVILVGTIQTLRVDSTEGRKVYAHHEDLEPHFVNIPKTLEGLEKIEEGAGQGTIKFSFRNLLALHRPLVIVDEAHNATSKLSVEVMQRINPACIIEFTATPAPNSNILHSVSASELKAEDMIKLPVVLTEHQTWQEAITAAVQTREKLQKLATNGNERDYIRPIVLFQAEDKGHEITYEIVLNYLLESEKIDREKIAIATGNQRELDGINLLDPNSPKKPEFIITVEALKEGWDCPFAYVFCSVATVHSKKDIEQILGRVLRMPYATKRTQEELNRAYAHVSEDSWKNAVPELQDRMISMGFEAQEANQAIVPQPRLIPDEETGQLTLPQPVKVILSAQPDLSKFTEEDLKQVSTIQLGENEIEYKISGEITPELAEKLILAAPKKDREFVEKTIAVQQAQQPRTPSQRGEKFEVPQLCLFVDGQWEVATKDWFLDPRDWDLLKYPAELSEAEFTIKEEANQWLIDIQGKRVVTRELERTFFDLSNAPTNWTVNQLSQELERKVVQDFVRPLVLQEFLRRTLAFLNEKRNIPLSDLARARYILEKTLRDKIISHYKDAMAKGYQTSLFGAKAVVETNFEVEFSYPTDPFQYPAHWYYNGRHIFNKNYYPMIGELESEGEEFECAQAIDRNTSIRCWVRNLSRRDNSVKLPTSTDYFYPDFVALLNDGRTLVVEYKGKPYETNDDSKEKINIGELWEKQSKGKGLFLFAVKRDGKGRDVYKQIEDKISGR